MQEAAAKNRSSALLGELGGVDIGARSSMTINVRGCMAMRAAQTSMEHPGRKNPACTSAPCKRFSAAAFSLPFPSASQTDKRL
jgi:hypothetical protein